MMECKFSCGTRIADNELDKYNQENMTKHVELLCEKAIEKNKEASQRSGYSSGSRTRLYCAIRPALPVVHGSIRKSVHLMYSVRFAT